MDYKFCKIYIYRNLDGIHKRNLSMTETKYLIHFFLLLHENILNSQFLYMKFKTSLKMSHTHKGVDNNNTILVLIWNTCMPLSYLYHTLIELFPPCSITVSSPIKKRDVARLHSSRNDNNLRGFLGIM